MFDINKYNITEEELKEYRDSLFVDIGSWESRKWDGKPFNETDVEVIKEHHGRDFFMFYKDGMLQQISKENNLSKILFSITEEEKDRMCEVHFAHKAFPTDTMGNLIKPVSISDMERAILETAINTEYLVCLAEINNM